MRALLNSDGTATVPPSVGWAERRLADLDYEIAKIKRQLGDENRTIQAGYAEWKRKAEKALRFLVQEAEQRRVWLAEQPVSELEDCDDDFEAFWRATVTKPKCMQRANGIFVKEDCIAEATHKVEGYFMAACADSNGRRTRDMLFCEEHAGLYNRLHCTHLAKPIK